MKERRALIGNEAIEVTAIVREIALRSAMIKAAHQVLARVEIDNSDGRTCI